MSAAAAVMDRRIVTFGGTRPQPGRVHPLVEYLHTLSGKLRPRILFVPTATGDANSAIVGFYERFPSAHWERDHLRLFQRTSRDLTTDLLQRDVVLVAGGNTASMLAVWRTHGVDPALRTAWEAGVILAGGSAGSLCWFECGTTDSFDLNELQPFHDGLGLLPGSHCPHYDGEPGRRPLYQSLIAGGFPAGYAIDDDAAILWKGTSPVEVVSARDGATAYRVEVVEGRLRETPLPARRLT